MKIKQISTFILSVASFVVLLWVFYLMYSIYQYSLVNDDITADAAIVLGAAVWQDQPSPVFEQRIKHSISLYNNGKVKYLIYTGGVGDNDNLAESMVAKMYAVNEGVPSEVIFRETSSTITLENLKGAKKIIGENAIHSVLIVSDPLHMFRAMTMAHNLGMTAYSSPTPSSQYKTWKSKSKFMISETYYYIGHILREWFS